MDDGKDLDGVSLIDVASEDDLLICPFAGVRETPDKPSKSCLQVELVPVPSDSPELKHNSSSKYNLRKSLAWDSAFFTSEGVLDPDELAVVNSTFRKAQLGVLPGIQEDTRKSGESCTTLDSDHWAVENETDLFSNIRASIQNFNAKSGRSPSSDRSNRGKVDFKASKCEQICSQAKFKPPFAPKRHDSGGKRFVVKDAGGGREEKPSLRPPRTAPGQASRGPSASRSIQLKSQIEGEQDKVTAVKSLSSVKITGSSKLHPIASPSLNSGPRGGLNSRMGKAPPESTRKKVSSSTQDQSSSKSANLYSVRATKDISRTRNVNAALKASAIMSPSSSIESFASESSTSSTSTARMPSSNSTNMLDYGSSPCFGVTARKAPQNNSAAKTLMPSGLRLPTPKMGYFDAENSATRSANRAPSRSYQAVIRNAPKLKTKNVPNSQENTGFVGLAAPKSADTRCLEFGNPIAIATGSPSSTLSKTRSHPKTVISSASIGPETRQHLTLGTEKDKCRDQFQPPTKMVTMKGAYSVVPDEETYALVADEGTGAKEPASLLMQDGFGTDKKWRTSSNHEGKENILPSNADISST